MRNFGKTERQAHDLFGAVAGMDQPCRCAISSIEGYKSVEVLPTDSIEDIKRKIMEAKLLPLEKCRAPGFNP